MNNKDKLELYKRERIGQRFLNKYNEWFTVLEYNNARDVLVKFDNGYSYKIVWKQITSGTVHSPYAKTVYDIGYIGEGKYKPYIRKGEESVEYKFWNGLLRRCYDPYSLNRTHWYRECYVENELHNFQSFCKWHNENYYEVPNDRMELDKDILNKGNKIYSKDTMIYVPRRINTLFTKNNTNRGNLPIGCYRKENEIYVQCSILDEKGNKKHKYLGRFPLDKPFQAFTCYKNFKENYIKQVADEYYFKGLIPKRLYDAMYKYEVEIND